MTVRTDSDYKFQSSQKKTIYYSAGDGDSAKSAGRAADKIIYMPIRKVAFFA